MASASSEVKIQQDTSEKTDPSIASKPRPVRGDESKSSKLCNQWVQEGLTQNKAIQFLIQSLEDLGCVPPSGFILCRQCEKPQASGFGKVVVEAPSQCDNIIRDFQSALELQKKQQQESGLSSPPPIQIQPEIFVCQQYMQSKLMTHKTMVHELIHAIDMCRTKMDPVNNCIHLACTEIRAESLSGECGFFKELPRMRQFMGHGTECVKRRALLSVRANPNCASRAEEYVTAAMPRCSRDNFPFAKHPNQLN